MAERTQYQFKLSHDDVTVIRQRLAAGEQCNRIAADYHVHPGHFSRLKHGRQRRIDGGGNLALQEIVNAEERRRSAVRERWDRVYDRAREITTASPAKFWPVQVFEQIVGEGLLARGDESKWHTRQNKGEFLLLPYWRNINWRMVQDRARELARRTSSRAKLLAALQREFPAIPRTYIRNRIKLVSGSLPAAVNS